MNKINFLLIGIITTTCLILACAFVPTGEVIKQEKPIAGNFSKIKVSSALNAIVTMSDKESIVVEANEKIMPFIEVKQAGDEVSLHMNNVPRNFNNWQVTIYVNAKHLNDIDVSGASKLKVQNKLVTDKLDLKIAGASFSVMDIDIKELETTISGASKVSLSGIAQNSELELSGASKFDGYNLLASNYDLDISGASSAEISCSSTMNLEISGASSLKYKGNPMMKKMEISGASSVKKSN